MKRMWDDRLLKAKKKTWINMQQPGRYTVGLVAGLLAALHDADQTTDALHHV